MTDFSLHCVGTWKDGSMASTKSALVIVNYDQQNHAYMIAKSEREEFTAWVAHTWVSDKHEQLDEESDEDFLDRIDVQIREAEWTL